MKDIVFLEGILAAVASQDTQKRLKAAEDFSNYLSDPSNGIEFIGFDKLLDGLIGWVNSSNFKASRQWKHVLLSCPRDFILLHYRLRKSVASFASMRADNLSQLFDLAGCRIGVHVPENILHFSELACGIVEYSYLFSTQWSAILWRLQSLIN